MAFENQTVSFRHATTDEVIEGVAVRIADTIHNYRLQAYAATYEFAVQWEGNYAFSDDSLVGDGTVMLIDDKEATLERVAAPHSGSFVPRWRAFYGRVNE